MAQDGYLTCGILWLRGLLIIPKNIQGEDSVSAIHINANSNQNLIFTVSKLEWTNV
jgi:hypothetical protein